MQCGEVRQKWGQVGRVGSLAVNTVTDGITVETLSAKYVLALF